MPTDRPSRPDGSPSERPKRERKVATTDRPAHADESAEAGTEVTAPTGESFGTRLARWWKVALRRPGWIACGFVTLVVALLLGDWFLNSDGRSAPPAKEAPPVARRNPEDVPLPDSRAGKLHLFTRPAPGFVVLVDGERVRGDDGESLRTPCEVVLEADRAHRITVAKEGYRDETRYLVPTTDTPLGDVFDPAPDPANESVSQLRAPWFGTKVGEPIPLGPLDTPGPETDPFVTPDGLTIYYVSGGPRGPGLHVAARDTPFEPFANPTLVDSTAGFDVPASPGVVSLGEPASGDVVTHLVYTIPRKSRVTAVTRRNALGGFDDTTTFRYDVDRTAPWIAAQMTEDGLALYWTADEPNGPVAYFSARESLDDEFTSTLRVPLPGGLPHLSHDGLRQYVYDGRTLRRARRTRVNGWTTETVRGRDVRKPVHEPFSELETVAEIPIADYRPSAVHRQFFVSRDEQWMFYADDPTADDGHLFAVRLHDGPGWGDRPRGTPIENRDFGPLVATAEPKPGDQPFEPPRRTEPDEPVDTTLAYTRHRAEFVGMMQDRRYDAAIELAIERLADPEFASSRQLVEWDRTEAERVRAFWADVEKGAASLAPGDTFSNRTVKLDFVRHEPGRLFGSRGGTEYEFEIATLPYTNVVALADRVLADDEPAAQLRVATFLSYEPDAVARATDARLKAAGDLGSEFTEHLAGRMLEQARLEFERERYRDGLAWVARLRDESPDSGVTGRAEELEAELYLRMKWQTVGPREWSGGETGTYAAGPERAAGSWLQSARKYQDFELQMEYRTTTPTGSGGVFFRYAGEGRRKPYNVDASFMVQLANDAGVPPDNFSTGALFGYEGPTTNAAGPGNAWNTCRMRVEGQNVRIWINETLVLDTIAVNEDVPLDGYIALDGITGGITYRKILLLELEPRF